MWSCLGYGDTPAEETAPKEETPPASPEPPPPTPTGGGIWSWFGYSDVPPEEQTSTQVSRASTCVHASCCQGCFCCCCHVSCWSSWRYLVEGETKGQLESFAKASVHLKGLAAWRPADRGPCCCCTMGALSSLEHIRMVQSAGMGLHLMHDACGEVCVVCGV